MSEAKKITIEYSYNSLEKLYTATTPEDLRALAIGKSQEEARDNLIKTYLQYKMKDRATKQLPSETVEI